MILTTMSLSFLEPHKEQETLDLWGIRLDILSAPFVSMGRGVF